MSFLEVSQMPAIALDGTEQPGAIPVFGSSGRLALKAKGAGGTNLSVGPRSNNLIYMPPFGRMPEDAGVLEWNYDPLLAQQSSLLSVFAAAGTLLLCKVKVREPTVCNRVVMMLAVAGATLTAGQNGVAIFSAAGVLLGQSNDMTTAWQGSPGPCTSVFGSSMSLPAGPVWVGFWWRGTTAPSFARGSGVGGSGNVYKTGSDSLFGIANTGLTTTAPSTLGTIVEATHTFQTSLNFV